MTGDTIGVYRRAMKPGLAVVVLASLVAVSCGPPAYLVTDPLFAAAAPEIVAAWATLAPGHAARTVALGPAGLADLHGVLGALPPGSPVLVGVTVPPDRRKEYVDGHPSLRLRFVGPPGGQGASLSVNRSQAWSMVAGAAAAPTPGWVVFPPDVSTEEEKAFADAWSEARGGPLTASRWPTVVPLPESGVIFDWAGPPADAVVAPAVGRLPIHGDPGVPRSGDQPAAHWSVRNAGLGEFLWTTTVNSTKFVEFAPLETVWDGR